MAAKAPAKVEPPRGGGARALVFLTLAVVAGAAATIMIYQVIQQYTSRIAEARKPEETQFVIIAAGDLYPGLVITESDIVGIDIPKKYVPEDAFSAAELVVGSIPRERILANEFIRPARLANSDTGVGLNALIPPGMRAVSLNLRDDASLSGFLVPGNRVDVVLTILPEGDNGGKQKQETLTLMQTVPVVAVNSEMLRDADAARKEAARLKAAEEGKPLPEAPARRRAPVTPSVTVAVTPDDAAKLVHAGQLGQLTLTLRADNDLTLTSSDGVTSTDFEDAKPLPPEIKAVIRKAAAKPPPDEGVTLRLIRGDSTATKTYNADGTQR